MVDSEDMYLASCCSSNIKVGIVFIDDFYYFLENDKTGFGTYGGC